MHTTGNNRPSVAIVTGAGRGIGLETARVLAEAGYAVVLAARGGAAIAQAASEISAVGGQALAVPTDVSDEDEVIRLFSQANERFGGVDVLVNSAGAAVFQPVQQLDLEGWNTTLAATLTGTFLCSKHALRYMLPRGSGQIVNVLSIAARMAFPGSAAYCAAKWGALGLTKVIAEEVRAAGIRVTALLPGATATPFWQHYETHPDLADMITPRHVAETILMLLRQPDDLVTDEMVIMPRKGIL
ncbi:MAG: SDR family oxidoreductase [Armatimonadota bacterium]|nr:SDR family oxidoreductase [Armatimonadota bacterium]